MPRKAVTPRKVAVNAHIPDDDTEALVANLSAMGFPQPVIAKRIGISPKTLRAKYREQIDHGREQLHAQLATTAINLALGGDRTMLIFCLKTKFGWAEKSQQTEVGADAIGRDTDPEVRDTNEDEDAL